jgi:hypothetical protein
MSSRFHFKAPYTIQSGAVGECSEHSRFTIEIEDMELRIIADMSGLDPVYFMQDTMVPSLSKKSNSLHYTEELWGHA